MSILYNPDKMRQGANNIQLKVGELTQILNNINSEINKISPNWEGKTKLEFITKYENSQSNINAYVECVLKISSQLKNIADMAEVTDNNIVSSLNL